LFCYFNLSQVYIFENPEAEIWHCLTNVKDYDKIMENIIMKNVFNFIQNSLERMDHYRDELLFLFIKP